MLRFLSSPWFPFVTALILAVGTTAAYAVLQPTGIDVGNTEILRIAKIAGWSGGLVFGLITFLSVGILNILRRIFRLRKTDILHAPTVFLGVLPWLILAWQLGGEPRFTPLARAVIDFLARPLLWGTLAAGIFAILLTVISLFLPKKS